MNAQYFDTARKKAFGERRSSTGTHVRAHDKHPASLSCSPCSSQLPFISPSQDEQCAELLAGTDSFPDTQQVADTQASPAADDMQGAAGMDAGEGASSQDGQGGIQGGWPYVPCLNRAAVTLEDVCMEDSPQRSSNRAPCEIIHTVPELYPELLQQGTSFVPEACSGAQAKYPTNDRGAKYAEFLVAQNPCPSSDRSARPAARVAQSAWPTSNRGAKYPRARVAQRAWPTSNRGAKYSRARVAQSPWPVVPSTPEPVLPKVSGQPATLAPSAQEPVLPKTPGQAATTLPPRARVAKSIWPSNNRGAKYPTARVAQSP